MNLAQQVFGAALRGMGGGFYKCNKELKGRIYLYVMYEK